MSAVRPPDRLSNLVDAAADGDERALAELVRTTQPAVWRLCAALGSDGEEEDLVQETLLRAWRHRSILDSPPAAVRAWLYTVSRNIAVDEWRSRRSRSFGRSPGDSSTPPPATGRNTRRAPARQ